MKIILYLCCLTGALFFYIPFTAFGCETSFLLDWAKQPKGDPPEIHTYPSSVLQRVQKEIEEMPSTGISEENKMKSIRSLQKVIQRRQKVLNPSFIAYIKKGDHEVPTDQDISFFADHVFIISLHINEYFSKHHLPRVRNIFLKKHFGNSSILLNFHLPTVVKKSAHSLKNTHQSMKTLASYLDPQQLNSLRKEYNFFFSVIAFESDQLKQNLELLKTHLSSEQFKQFIDKHFVWIDLIPLKEKIQDFKENNTDIREGLMSLMDLPVLELLSIQESDLPSLRL